MQPDITTAPPIRRLILHGASVRAAAQSAQRAEFDVFGIDLFGDQDARAACRQFIKLPSAPHDSEQESLQKAIRQASIAWPDAMIIPVGDIGGDPEGKNPESLQRWASAADWKIPPTFVPDHERVSNHRLLVKSNTTSGGLGVRWQTMGDSMHADKTLQAFVAGRNYGATLIGNGVDCRVIAVCRSHRTRIGSKPFVFAGSSGPVSCSNNIAIQLGRLGRSFVTDSNHRGLFNVDFITGRDKSVYLLEINARWSASMELADLARQDQNATAPSLIAEHIDAISHQKLPRVTALPQSERIKRVVYANQTGYFCQSRLTTLIHKSKRHHAEPSWADLPHDQCPVAAGQPLTTLLVTSPRYRDLYRATQACVVECT